MRGKSTSGQAVALVYSWLKRQCICDYSITMCTGRRTSIYLHTSSTKLKPLVVPPALCTVYFILNFLPKLEASALRALPNWAHQAKQSGLGWIHTSSGNNQCENGPNENPFLQVLSRLEIISCFRKSTKQRRLIPERQEEGSFELFVIQWFLRC